MARDYERSRGAHWYRPQGAPRADPTPRDGRSTRKGRRSPLMPRRPGDGSHRKHRPVVPDRQWPTPSYPERERPARPVPGQGAIPRRPYRIPKVPLGGAVVAPLIAADLFDDFISPWFGPDPSKPPTIPSNYSWCSGPVMPTARWATGPAFRSTGNCDITVPLFGQSANATTVANWASYPLGNLRHYWMRIYHNTALTPYRGVLLGTITRDYVVSPQPQPSPKWSQYWNADPNLVRWLPGPALQPGFGSPVRQPERDPLDRVTSPNPEGSPYQPDYRWAFDIGPAPGVVKRPIRPPAGRRPPRKGERQRKVITKTRAIAIGLYRALDAASEASEIVDAFYEALPDHVKERWNRPDRMGDNFGQYGLGGADWKLQALYYNWHQVDMEAAIKAIIKNQLSDSIVGGMQAVLPRNTGAAHSQGEIELAEWLDWFFSQELGLD